jgi:hypothetical protein
VRASIPASPAAGARHRRVKQPAAIVLSVPLFRRPPPTDVPERATGLSNSGVTKVVAQLDEALLPTVGTRWRMMSSSLPAGRPVCRLVAARRTSTAPPRQCG